MTTIYDRPEHVAAARPGRRASSPRRSSRAASAGRSRASSRARCCARWARSACSASPIRRVRRRGRRRADRRSCSQEALSRSTFGGFAVTVLVHTDMASPHLVHARHEGAARALPARGHRGRAASPRWRSPSPTPAPTSPSIRTRARRDGDRLGAERHQDVHHQRRARATSTSSPRAPIPRRKGSRGISMFIVEKGTPGLPRRPRAEEAGLAVARTPPSWCSRTAASRPRTCSARRTRGFYAIMTNFQTERIALGAMAIGHCADGAGAHARLGEAAQGVRRRRLFDKQTIRQRLAMLRCQGRGGAAVPLSLRLAGRRRAATACARCRCSRR